MDRVTDREHVDLSAALDPDAERRVRSFGQLAPMRARGLQQVRESVELTAYPVEMAAMAAVQDLAIPGPAGTISARMYKPTDTAAAPAVAYFHGGGMVMGSVRSFEPLARALAAASSATVISVDYRLAPESPPPAQFDDAYSATTWISTHAGELGIDPCRLAVAGDSAGGSLAAAVALAARDHDGPNLLCQVLMYPGLDRDMAAPSIAALAHAPMLSRDDIFYMFSLADLGAGIPQDTYRVPAYATDLSGLPPAIVATAGCDPIRDWGERYAARLRDAGVQTTLTRYPGVYHGFLMRSEALARGRLAVAEIGALLHAKFTCPLTQE